MSSEGCQAIGFMLRSYLSTCDSQQAQELKELLISTISNIDNVNLAEQKDTDSTAETEEKQHRAEKKIIDIELFKKLYENARIHPNYSYPRLERIVGLNPNTIKTNKKRLYFKGAYRRLKDVVKLARVMDDKNVRRYEREIDGYNDME